MEPDPGNAGEGRNPLTAHEVIVIGGGAIGLGIAWRTAQLNMRALIIERHEPGSGASGVSAGMLAPVTEANFGEELLLRLNLESSRRYPSFLAQLQEASGEGVKQTGAGTLFVAQDRDRKEALDRLLQFRLSLGLEVESLSSEQCRVLEPSLHPRVRGGFLAAADGAVDPRVLCRALAKAVVGAGGEVRAGTEVAVIRPGSPPTVALSTGEELSAEAVVLAAGCWSGNIEGAPSEVASALRPVKGQILRLGARRASALPSLNVRTDEVYLVPRDGGELVVGATVEEQGFDTSVTAGAVFELLRSAEEIVPGIREMELLEASAGLRPGTPDNLPLIGPTSTPGVLAATGHFRNGILLTPITADIISALLSGETPPIEVAAYSPARFSK